MARGAAPYEVPLAAGAVIREAPWGSFILSTDLPAWVSSFAPPVHALVEEAHRLQDGAVAIPVQDGVPAGRPAAVNIEYATYQLSSGAGLSLDPEEDWPAYRVPLNPGARIRHKRDCSRSLDSGFLPAHVRSCAPSIHALTDLARQVRYGRVGLMVRSSEPVGEPFGETRMEPHVPRWRPGRPRPGQDKS
jgi:hypothetical protein